MKKRILAIAIAATMAMGLAACGGSNGSTATTTAAAAAAPAATTAAPAATTAAPAATKAAAAATTAAAAAASGKKLTIGYAPATLNNAFWGAVEDGVKKAIKEKNADVDLVEVDANGDQSVMNDKIGDLISSKIDCLLLAPADSTAVLSAIDQLDKAKIPVVNFDTPIDTDKVKTIIASDNTNAGYVVGKDAASKMPDGAKILVLHSPRASACVQRFDGFVKALDESGKKYTIVNNLDGKGDTETSLGLAADALVADPDLNVIFAVNDPSAMGAEKAVEQTSAKLTGNVMIYGVDGNPDACKLIKEGKMEGTGAQSPQTIGYDSMMAAFDILDGKSVEKNVVVKTFLMSKENIGQFDITGWQ